MLHSLIFSFLILAQPSSPPKTDFEVIREQGSLLSVKLVPGQPIKIFIVGREEAEIDLSKTNWAADVDLANLSVSFKQTNPNPGKILRIKRFENHYIVDDPLTLTNGSEFNLQIKEKNKKPHSFKVKVKQLP
jgi:hypothetical protein